MRKPQADVFAGGLASAPSGVLPSEHSRFSQSFQYFCGALSFYFFMRTVIKICLIKFIMNFVAIGLFSKHSHTERTDNNTCGRRSGRGLASAQVLRRESGIGTTKSSDH